MRRQSVLVLAYLCMVLSWTASAVYCQSASDHPVSAVPVQGTAAHAANSTAAGQNDQAKRVAPQNTQGEPQNPPNQSPGSSAGATVSPPAETQSNNEPATASVPVPVLDSITPPAALIAPNQTITLSGSNFRDGVTVTFTDFQNNPFTAKVISREDQHVSVVATLGSAGTWSVTAANPGGKASSALKFPVANAPSIKFTSPSFIAFAISALVSTAFLVGIIWYVLVAIRKAQNTGWSLGEALSEESILQPKTVEIKSQVIIFASTSRVIALVGLMGILSTVVGMGYSIMWNLTIYGTVPDLTQIRSFLLGSACLFAPYLANQLSGIFTPASKPQSSAPDAQSSTSGVSGIVPTSPVANAAPQAVQLTGVGFQTGLSVTITDPSGGAHPVGAADITAVNPTLVSANAVLDAPGNWKAVVANPATAPMPAFAFVVFGPPRITGLTGTPPLHNSAAQTITFVGTGFVSGLMLTLTSPAAAVGQVQAMVTQVTSQQVIITAVLADAGNWQVVATNPGNHASPAFPFIVT